MNDMTRPYRTFQHGPDDPEQAKPPVSVEIDRRALKERILESAKFAATVQDVVLDELGLPENQLKWGILAYYCVRRDDAELGRFLREIIGQKVHELLKDEMEQAT